VGNPDLDEERALSLSANLRYAGERWSLDATMYYNDFSDFIFEAATGEEEDELPVFQYLQDDATFVGFEAEVRATVAEWHDGSVTLSGRFDTVSGELDVSGNEPLPRIPPTRYGLGVEGDWGPVRASVDHTWVRSQDEVADFELPTESYQDLQAYLGVDLPLGTRMFTVFLQGRNLTDQDQRQHTSFIKDFAPMPGRTLEAGLRARF
jgi:iron complex outermembrane receptor protein